MTPVPVYIPRFSKRAPSIRRAGALDVQLAQLLAKMQVGMAGIRFLCLRIIMIRTFNTVIHAVCGVDIFLFRIPVPLSIVDAAVDGNGNGSPSIATFLVSEVVIFSVDFTCPI